MRFSLPQVVYQLRPRSLPLPPKTPRSRSPLFESANGGHTLLRAGSPTWHSHRHAGHCAPASVPRLPTDRPAGDRSRLAGHDALRHHREISRRRLRQRDGPDAQSAPRGTVQTRGPSRNSDGLRLPSNRRPWRRQDAALPKAKPAGRRSRFRDDGGAGTPALIANTLSSTPRQTGYRQDRPDRPFQLLRLLRALSAATRSRPAGISAAGYLPRHTKTDGLQAAIG